MRRTFRVRCIRPATQGTRALARGPSPGPRAGGAVLPLPRKEIVVSCVGTNDQQLARLADAIAQRVGQQRFHVWFNNSTRLDLRQDGLEIAVPNDFISEWIGKNFTRPIQEAAHEVLGCPLQVRFSVVPELFEVEGSTKKNGEEAPPAEAGQAGGRVGAAAGKNGARGKGANGQAKGANGRSNGHVNGTGHARAAQQVVVPAVARAASLNEAAPRDYNASALSPFASRPRLRH